ncbi:hypothetical protein BWQ96_09644 [Gracilariopsis chorda]|uniref:Uncharacterized protein n=1 Tax=Gracilariopsis chorda TaxID=448386 RepID=A0A2V3IF02_9FLOR|nr:hypothetical protein BWQ96_09644 [Gracilariopsis chorda]|eukprot:PXF40647.1 hypothetical protein BWQ96_09644 [Gracilariopsis chorda]
MDELASGLETEARSLPNNSYSNEPVSARPQQPPGTKKVPSTARASSSSIRSQVRVGFPAAQLVSLRSSALGHASFSSTAVPFARRSTNDRHLSSSQSSDEFGVLESSEAKVWQNIVRNDETRITGSRYKPLSRGYRFDVEPPQKLHCKKAVELVGQSVDAPATTVPIKPSKKKEIQRILQENSHECLEHVESEVRSRLLEDEHFDSDVYPSATSRFLAWVDMLE